jgi:hypothetical protein
MTLVSALPFVLGLGLSYVYVMAPRYPHWLLVWPWVSYGLLFAGEIRAWWIPFLWRCGPDRAARYRILFGSTHPFLPERNGFASNTLHLLLHAVTLATLLLLPML